MHSETQYRAQATPMVAAMLFLLVVGCERASAERKNPQREIVYSNAGAQQTLLEGPADTSAHSALYDYSAELSPLLPETVSSGPNGLRVDRTSLTIAFSYEATVGEVNTMLQSVGASIVEMMPGVDILDVAIPDPGDLASYEALVLQLKADPTVRRVTMAALSSSDALPAPQRR